MLRLCAGTPTRFWPPSSSAPELASVKPAMTLSVVVLPEPLGPSSVMNSPALM